MRYLALAVFFLAACGPTSAAAPGKSLYLAFHKGDVYSYSYKLTANETLDGAQVTLNETAGLTYTVRSVDGAGTADLSLDPSSVVITSTEGQVTTPMNAPSNATMDLSVATDGRVLTENLNGNGTGGSINWGVLPGSAVKPGATWSADYDMTVAGSVGTNHFTTVSRYLRNESFQGANAAVVETTMTNASDIVGTATPGGTTASAKGTSRAIITTWIDLHAHRVLKSHSTATFDQTATFDAPSMPPPTVVSIKGDETSDMLPA